MSTDTHIVSPGQLLRPEAMTISRTVILHLGYLYILLILIDAPLVVLYTLTKSATLAKLLLYASEGLILLTFLYLAFNALWMKVPVFIYVYTLYIMLIALVGLLFNEPYGIMKDARRFLAPVPPVMLGYYFAYAYGENRERVIKKIITFLTVLSIISLVEWLLFFVNYPAMISLYSKFFRTGAYYAHVKHHVTFIPETGLTISGMTQHDIWIPGFEQFKRATGIFIEGYSAGFNAAIAAMLILYCGVAKYKPVGWHFILLLINILACILATSRSAYIFLLIVLVMYLIIERKPHIVLAACGLPLLYGPFREYLMRTVETLGGGIHRQAIVQLPSFLAEHVTSVEGVIGAGFGTLHGFVDWGAIHEISNKLGIFGLLCVIMLYYSVMFRRIQKSKANIFFISSAALSILAICIYSGRIFGYKSLGMVMFMLGFLATVNKPSEHGADSEEMY